MKPGIKKYILGFFTFVSLVSAINTADAYSSVGPDITNSSGVLALATVLDIAGHLSQPGTIGDVANLLASGTFHIPQSVQAFDIAALTKPLQAEPAGWERSSAVSTAAAPRPAQPLSPGAPGDAVFGTVAIPFRRLAALEKFAPSLAEMTDGSQIACGNGACTAAASAVKVAYTTTKQASIRDKMNSVNFAVNHAIRYRTDMETYHVQDYWATPAETLKHQQGDCEDFAILKMAALHADGVDLKDMALVVLYDQRRHFYHAILSVAVNGHFFILDNMRDEVLADTQLPDYLPLYSIVDGKGYIHGTHTHAGQTMAANMPPLEKVAPGEGVTF